MDDERPDVEIREVAGVDADWGEERFWAVFPDGARAEVERRVFGDLAGRLSEVEDAEHEGEPRGLAAAPVSRPHGRRDFSIAIDARAHGKLERAYPGIDEDGMSAVVEGFIELLPDPRKRRD